MADARDPRLVELIDQLRTGDERSRCGAAASLARWGASLPAWCAPALVAALNDEAGWHEEHSDWDGTVLSGTFHQAKAYAEEALLRVGAAALPELAKLPDQKTLLVKIVAAASPDALAALPADFRAQLPALVKGHWLEADALKALSWVDSEGGSEVSRLIGRLEHQTTSVVVEACFALAALPPTREAADAVMRRVARGGLGAADKALVTLAPHASEASVDEFLERRVIAASDAPGDAILNLVASWGPRAAKAAPALMALLMDRLRPAPHRSWSAPSAANAVAAVLGPPRSGDDPRVVHFLAVTEQNRGAMEPPDEVLSLLVRACTGVHALSPFVIEPLTKKLVDGPNAARVDAAQRLFALQAAAEPAGEALLQALDTLMADNWSSGVSTLAWTLSHAGAARQRVLPRFIAMLEGPFARQALHGLHGMSEEAAAAIPAIEAYLSRAKDKWDRENAQRTLTRVRHLSGAGA